MSKINLKSKKISSIFILLVIIVVSVLGYFVWHNYLLNDGKSKDKSSNSKKVDVDLNGIVSDTIYGSGLSVKHPKDWVVTDGDLIKWTMDHHDVEGVSEDYAPSAGSKTITSPDGKVSVIFDIAAAAGLLTCDETDEVMKIGKIDVDSISDYDGYVFGIVINNDTAADGGAYLYEIGVFKDGDWTTKAKVGDPQCSVGSRSIPLKSDELGPAVTISIMLNDIVNGNTTTLDDVNKAIETDNFNIAKQIVQSLYVKK